MFAILLRSWVLCNNALCPCAHEQILIHPLTQTWALGKSLVSCATSWARSPWHLHFREVQLPMNSLSVKGANLAWQQPTLRSRLMVCSNPSRFINISWISGIEHGFCFILLLSSLKSKTKWTVLSFSGTTKAGAAHSKWLAFLRMPAWHNLLSMLVRMHALGIGFGPAWWGIHQDFSIKFWCWSWLKRKQPGWIRSHHR